METGCPGLARRHAAGQKRLALQGAGAPVRYSTVYTPTSGSPWFPYEIVAEREKSLTGLGTSYKR